VLKNTPADIIDKHNKEINAVLRTHKEVGAYNQTI
jgi:hypothetical protein